MKDKKEKTKRKFSGGGVVFRKNEKGETEWLLVKHSGYKRWIFPKGLSEEGESLKEAAVREVEEEAGIKAEIIDRVGQVDLFFYQPAEEGSEEKERVFKTVTFFLMKYLSGNIQDHGWEVSEAQWLSFEKAKDKLDFDNSKEILEKARDILKEKEKQPKLF